MTDRVWVLLGVAAALVAAVAAQVFLYLRDRHEGHGEAWGRRGLTPPVPPGQRCLAGDARSPRR
jgi:hypothetical protein